MNVVLCENKSHRFTDAARHLKHPVSITSSSPNDIIEDADIYEDVVVEELKNFSTDDSLFSGMVQEAKVWKVPFDVNIMQNP